MDFDRFVAIDITDLLTAKHIMILKWFEKA